MSTPSEFVPISQLPVVPGPLTDDTLFIVTAAGVSYQAAARRLVLPTDPLITAMDFTSSLTSSRYLTAGAGITMIDGGAGGPFTIMASSSGGIVVFDQAVAAALAGTEQDWNPTGWNAGLGISRLEVTPSTSPGILGGLDSSGAVDGQVIALMNDSAADSLRLIHNDGGSAATNRFYCPGGANFTLVAMQSIFLMKRSNGWRLFT